MNRKVLRRFRPVHGILLLDKPLGLSSNQALQQARFCFEAEKAGHTGSLDPLASGMLPLCFGEATKLAAYLLDADKRYLTTATLGQVSSTGDSEGELSLPIPVPIFSTNEMMQCLDTFRGTIQQIPPMYSALKQSGKPLYELARQGIEVTRAARTVSITQLTLLAHQGNQLSLDITCSKGTYIRTLVQDIGAALGCGAYVSQLRRLEVQPFAQLPMYSLAELQLRKEQGGLEALESCLLPMEVALGHLPKLILKDAELKKVRMGQPIMLTDERLLETSLESVCLYDSMQRLIGLGQVVNARLQPKRLLVYGEH